MLMWSIPLGRRAEVLQFPCQLMLLAEFYWDMVRGKNEYLYYCLCDIDVHVCFQLCRYQYIFVWYICYFNYYFIYALLILSFLLYSRFLQPSSYIILVTLLYFEQPSLTNLAAFLCTFQDLRYLLFDMSPMLHMHILIVNSHASLNLQ